MVIYGYAKTYKEDISLENQIKELKTFKEDMLIILDTDDTHKELYWWLPSFTEKDLLVVVELEVLGPSLHEFVNIMEKLSATGTKVQYLRRRYGILE